MEPFVLDHPPCRVVFGVGTIERLPEELRRLDISRPLLICTASERAVAEAACRPIAASLAGVFADAVMHHPIETIQAARDMALAVRADACITIGGGTTTGTGKAIAIQTGLPIVAVPTTYAGSEMTPIFGLTDGGQKRVSRDRRVLPRSVIYDPKLTVSLPPSVSAASGLNALAHCIEGLYAPDANPISRLMALEGTRALARALPDVVRKPTELAARADALYGAWLAGIVLGTVSMGLHHKLCHVLGGTFGLPHAETHAVVLPHVAAYNREAAPAAMRDAASAIGAEEAGSGLFNLASLIGAPVSLKAIGMPVDGLDRAARLSTESQYPNPRPIEYGAVRALLGRAYNGDRP